MNINIVTICLCLIFQKLVKADGSTTFENVIRFPYGPVQGPFIGIFVAISLPLDLPEYNIFFSYNFEANYNLPSNQTDFTYPPLVSKRSWDRKYLYDVFEFKIKSHGYPGRECMLRTICEAALYSTENTSVLGDLFHIILTPSTSMNPDLNKSYEQAELHAKVERNCAKYQKKCNISFLDVISQVKNYFDS